MCGITGYWQRSGPIDFDVIGRMASVLQHRGPDDCGVWADERAGLVLAHRRLSIIDVSPAGHQPMSSPCGRYVLTYNGEIYNHADLRRELEEVGGHFDWRGHSDTETLLATLRHWGIKGALERLNGMFAFALWDASERALYLARDRMGEKPLYYGHAGDVFLFGSELKSFCRHSEWRGTISRDALAAYLRHNCVPAPWSIYEGILKLPPAHFVTIRQQGLSISEPTCYWNLGNIAERGVRNAGTCAEELLEELDALLRHAVKCRMASDVPLGAFLSGGIDSSIIVALMQAQSDRPVRTFSIGFYESDYNEAICARSVADHLGTEHTELYVTPEQALAVIPQLPTIWDEPFSDSSQIPTYLVSDLTRRYVTVGLSGDGGDELFCGYARYAFGHQVWRMLQCVPWTLRRSFASILRGSFAKALAEVAQRLPNESRIPHLADRLPKVADILEQESRDSFYQQLVSHWKAPGEVVRRAREAQTLFSRQEGWPMLADIRDWMMYMDSMTYLPDDILTKVDRASMAVSLEARAPLLDHRVVEFAWRVPVAFKHRARKGKWLLRQLLHRYVPKNLVERPKKGFGVPLDSWLRGPLKDWAEDLLEEQRVREDGFFVPESIQNVWQEHKRGERRWHYYLWDVLMFQAWYEEQKYASPLRPPSVKIVGCDG